MIKSICSVVSTALFKWEENLASVTSTRLSFSARVWYNVIFTLIYFPPLIYVLTSETEIKVLKKKIIRLFLLFKTRDETVTFPSQV